VWFEKLKAKSTLGLGILFVLAYLIVSVQAPLSSLNSGFAITTDYHEEHIEYILPATPVTAMAVFIVESESPLTPGVEWIQFIWRSPSGMERNQSVYPPFDETTWTDKKGNTHKVFYLNDTFTPITQGPWGIQAIFRGENGTIKGQDTTDPAFGIKATSFTVIPEVPVGTIAAFLAMLGALSILAIKKKSRLAFPSRTP